MRKALRAKLVRRAEAWRYNSLWRRENGDERSRSILADWPAARPRNWLRLVNRPQSPKELEALRRCVSKGKPYGSGEWEMRVARRLGLEHTLRSRGRPRKGKDEEK